MKELIFIATVISILVLAVITVVKLIRKKAVRRQLRIVLLILTTYLAFWALFYFIRKDVVYDFGTNICFDDWCITVTKVELVPEKEGRVIVNLRITNNAKRIAQKPSEPSVVIEDDKGNRYYNSTAELMEIEKVFGKQRPIDTRLELHEIVDTKVVFNLPTNNGSYKIVINEGPWITKLIWPSDRTVFEVK